MSNSGSSIGVDLSNLAKLLFRYKLCKNVTPLVDAGQFCISKSDRNRWTYHLKKITFNTDEVGGTLPSNATDISVSLSLIIDGKTSLSSENTDPLNQLLFNIEIDAFRWNDNLDILYSSWHLDRHLSSPGDGVTKYSHPYYHFTFGGLKMEKKGDIFGASIILPSPRLVYPPMDAVLGIDFILQNYLDKDKIRKLVTDPDYIQIVKNSQLRLWKPFFSSLCSFWGKETNEASPAFSPKKIFPLYY